MHFPSLGRHLWQLWGGRLLLALLVVPLPLSHPHVWRQVDTLGVSLRYWLRWQVEPDATRLWLPAVLQSGDGSGLMAMEWPLLNILSAPLFAAGPWLGTSLARALILLLCFGLTLLNIKIWRMQTLAGIPAERAWRWLPIVGLGLTYFPKFIPDSLAMLLVLTGAGLILQVRPRLGLVGLLWTLGLLMKPTAVISLGLVLLAPQARQLRFYRLLLPPAVVALTVAGSYYLWGTAWLQASVGGESLFRLRPPPPLSALAEFFGQWRTVAELLLHGIGTWGAIPLLLLAGAAANARRAWLVWLLLALQIVTIAALDGAHALVHRYYFLGALPSFCLLLEAGFSSAPRAVRYLLALAIVADFGNRLGAEIRPLWAKNGGAHYLSFGDCSALRAQLPEWPWHRGAVFRTAPRPYPLVGLCVGEREGSVRSPYGLYLQSETPPPDCIAQAQAGSLVAFRCPAL